MVELGYTLSLGFSEQTSCEFKSRLQHRGGRRDPEMEEGKYGKERQLRRGYRRRARRRSLVQRGVEPATPMDLHEGSRPRRGRTQVDGGWRRLPGVRTGASLGRRTRLPGRFPHEARKTLRRTSLGRRRRIQRRGHATGTRMELGSGERRGRLRLGLRLSLRLSLRVKRRRTRGWTSTPLETRTRRAWARVVRGRWRGRSEGETGTGLEARLRPTPQAEAEAGRRPGRVDLDPGVEPVSPRLEERRPTRRWRRRRWTGVEAGRRRRYRTQGRPKGEKGKGRE